MIAHTLNNGLMATFVFQPAFGERLGVATSPYLPWSLTGAGTIIMLVGLALLWSLPSVDGPGTAYKKNGPTG